MPPRRCALALGSLCVALTIGACTFERDAGPLSTMASTLELVDCSPAPGSAHVSLAPTIELRFNVPIAGESLAGTAVRLYSGRIEVPGATRVDLLASTITFFPAELLRPRLLHRVRIADTIRGVDGSWLPDLLTVEFTTGGDGSAGLVPPGPPPPATVNGENLQPLWAERCVSCHGSRMPRSGIDLSTPDRVSAALVRVKSTQVNLLRVDPGNHASSYLLRKLLGRHGIAGMPMPPDDESRLHATHLRRVADWVDSGAPID